MSREFGLNHFILSILSKSSPEAEKVSAWLRFLVVALSLGICVANGYNEVTEGNVSNTRIGWLYIAWLHCGLIPAWFMMFGYFETLESTFSPCLAVLSTTLLNVWTIWNPPVPFTESVAVAFPIAILISFYLIWAVIDLLMVMIEHLFGIDSIV